MPKLGHQARCLQSLGQSFEITHARCWDHVTSVRFQSVSANPSACRWCLKRAREASRHWHAPQIIKLWHQWNVRAVSYPHLWHTNLWLALKSSENLFQKAASNPIRFYYRMDERMCKWMDVLYWFLVGKFTRKCFYSMWWKRAFMVARVGHFAFTPCVLQPHYFPAEKWCRRKGDSLLVAVLLTQTCACVTVVANLEPPSFPFC